MSPNVGNFVHDLVEMAKAMETLPQVQAELDRVNQTLSIQAETIMSRETAILRYKQDIEELQSKVRSLEVERDDASFRVLEAEDKAHVVLNMARSIASAVGNVITTLDPPKPQPEPVVEQPSVPEAVQSIEPQPQGQGEDRPTEPSSMGSGDGSTLGENSSQASQPLANQDQGEVNPTVASSEVQSQNATSATAENASGTSSNSGDKPPGPYTGKSYKRHPVYVAYWDWINGGGTDASYYS